MGTPDLALPTTGGFTSSGTSDRLCFFNLTSVCSHGAKCTRIDSQGVQVDDAYASKFIGTIKKGVEHVLENGPGCTNGPQAKQSRVRQP